MVDDDPGFRKGIARLLRANGFEVASYSSAEEFQAHADLATRAASSSMSILTESRGSSSGASSAARVPMSRSSSSPAIAVKRSTKPPWPQVAQPTWRSRVGRKH